MYGCGLRLFECLKLRVQDLNLDVKVLTVHDGKGQKDRTVPLPQMLMPALKAQLVTVRQVHQEDLAAGYVGTFLPSAVAQKYNNASTEWVWQWFFPAKTLTRVQEFQEYRRYHLMRPMCKRPSSGPYTRRTSPNGRRRIRFATVLPVICCRRITIFGPFRRSWGIVM